MTNVNNMYKEIKETIFILKLKLKIVALYSVKKYT